jgi:hypothetical protein
MKPFNEMTYHPVTEAIVGVLCSKTQNNDPLFFRVMVSFYLSQVASSMRAKVNTPDRGVIPINTYAFCCAQSGFGKGHSTNIVEESVVNQFKEIFIDETMPEVAEESLIKLAMKRAARKAEDPDEELIRVQKEYEDLGAMPYSFDSGTTPAFKQVRHKALMAQIGSLNFICDEIGSNLLGNQDLLSAYLETYDKGLIKQKLTKNTTDNKRNEEIRGAVPANMMLFGTPSKLLNGGKTEDEFYSMLETGYARRCLFGFSNKELTANTLTPEQIYDIMTSGNSIQVLQDISDRLGSLANSINYNKQIDVPKKVAILLIEYKLLCENLANELAEHEEIRKAELNHRYFKALKLAGAYAFIDGDLEITEESLNQAIKLVEASGVAFEKILKRDRNYVKLAKYIAEIGKEITHVDLTEDLPFYKGSETQKRELMNLAIAYGYKNNIVIKKQFNDGIEFLVGESLKETNLDEIILACSTDWTTGYQNEVIPFDKLNTLTQQPDYHWTNHHLADGYRKEENALVGFNLLVLDVDDGITMKAAQVLLKDYQYHMYTTKRHTPEHNRFRVIMPLSHTLKMNASEFKEFTSNVFEWLPFDIDKQTNQRARKWATCTGQYHNNPGKLLDALLFIPKTSKNEERKKNINDLQSLNNLERWFISKTGTGNRSNQLIKFALMLVDAGKDITYIQNSVLALNSKLANKMAETEIMATILVTASKAIHARDTKVPTP